MQKNSIQTVVKGMCVGSTMLVPGVSGGSMAMILGVYDRLITSVSSFMKHKKESFLFLSLFSLGGIAGMILFAKPLLFLIEKYPMPMLYFFIGAVAGGIPLMCKKAEIEKVTWKMVFYLLFGIIGVLLIGLFPQQGPADSQGIAGMGMLALAGIIAAAALVLPGISVSYLLLVMGLYDTIMEAIGSLRLAVLFPLGIGLLLGIILTTKFLETVMNKFPQPTYLIILGFILGSVAEIFPGIPSGIEWVTCPVTLIAGYLVIRLMSGNEMKK